VVEDQQVLKYLVYVCQKKEHISEGISELATAASNIYLIDGGDALLAPMSKVTTRHL
jgi:hypothetical protein